MKNTLSIIALFLLTITVNAQQLDSFIKQYTTSGKSLGIRSNFNGVILVAKNDKILLHKAYGYANMETKKLLNLNSKFLLGSITKPFVAQLVLQQVEKGNMKLNQPISDILPFIDPEKGKHITIHRLLANTSGIPHYDGLRNHIKSMRSFSSKKLTPKEYAQLVNKTGLSSIPNSKFQYSSLGYVLLGAALEKVSKQTFSQLIDQYISKPLKLKNIGYGSNEFLNNEIVKNYRFRKQKYQENKNRDQSNTYTAGGMHGTAKEVFLWSNALRTNKLLKRRFTKKMFHPNLSGYAYGWMRNDIEILRYIPHTQFYGHSGSVNGFTNYLFLADDGTTIIVLSNTSPLQPYKLVSDIYKKVHQEDLNISTRIILPSFRNKKQFFKEGGYEGIESYHKILSKNAGFNVFPSGGYMQRIVRMHLKEKIDLASLEKLIYNMSKKNPFAEDMLNKIAYEFAKKDTYKALYYFKLNTKLFSKSANTWDSLGEFYEKQKQLSKAKLAYKKAVSLAKKYFHTNSKTFENNLKKLNRNQ